jgi:hypothetical protein
VAEKRGVASPRRAMTMGRLRVAHFRAVTRAPQLGASAQRANALLMSVFVHLTYALPRSVL